MPEHIPKLFSPQKIGNLELRNRSIRSAAFEGMCPGNSPSEQLLEYHRSVAAGGIGMTTVAYAATHRTGLSFPHQLWLRKEVVPELKKLTEAVHSEGAACSIQIGHCGNMAKRAVIGKRPIAPTGRFNLYGPSWPRMMNRNDIDEIVKSFGDAVNLARESGFDAVEVHAGHGYLISQFLSPYTNTRSDEFGGSFENRTRFMRMVMREVKKAAANDIAVLVKMNMSDGFKSGMVHEECLEVAQILEEEGADALVLSGGFVSKAPMHILRGKMPVKVLAHYIPHPVMKTFVSMFGNAMIKPEPFVPKYFLESAKGFRESVKIPCVYVGGLTNKTHIEDVLNEGFEFVAMARALLKDPDFINKLLNEELSSSPCDTCNFCIAVMYSQEVACIQNMAEQQSLRRFIDNG